MSEKSQSARVDEQEDLLEQIITQGLEKIKTPPQSNDRPDVPGPEASPLPRQEDTERAADRKNRRSTVYLYLLVLFGAAFLMLLLAYFIQQRTISGLRDSMNLSREELLAEISALEEKNTALDEKLARLNRELAQWQPQYDGISLEAVDSFFDSYYLAQEELYSWEFFWTLEQYYQLENYEACAAVLLMQEQGLYTYRAPDKTRQAEIIQAVVDADILDGEYAQHPEDYQYLLTAYSQP